MNKLNFKANDKVNEIGWKWDELGGGVIEGADNAAMDNFASKATYSMAKEVVQNSIDAALTDKNNKKMKVKVQFAIFSRPKTELEAKFDLSTLEAAIKSAYKSNINIKKGNTGKLAFYENAFSTLAQKDIRFIRASDFHTTGLTGSDCDINDDEEKTQNSKWLQLVRGAGCSSKGDSDGGSHGQGKNAGNICSTLHSVFYTTIAVNENNGSLNEAFQGVSVIGTHKNENNVRTMGTGFFCNRKDFSPIRHCYSLDPNFKRQSNETGTDVYIIGFNETPTTLETILVSVLNEYLMAIWNDKLEVEIIDETGKIKYKVNKSLLNEIFVVSEAHPVSVYRSAVNAIIAEHNYGSNGKNNSEDDDYREENDWYADKYYMALIKNQPLKQDIVWNKKTIGTVSLYLESGLEFTNRRIAMSRQIGMHVMDFQVKSSINYSGLLFIKGDEINKNLASIEDITHSMWQLERIPLAQRAEPQSIISQMRHFCRISVRHLCDESACGLQTLDGLADILPSESDEDEENNSPNLPDQQNKLVPYADVKDNNADEKHGAGLIINTDEKNIKNDEQVAKAEKLPKKNYDNQDSNNNKKGKQQNTAEVEKNILPIRYRLGSSKESNGDFSYIVRLNSDCDGEAFMTARPGGVDLDAVLDVKIVTAVVMDEKYSHQRPISVDANGRTGPFSVRSDKPVLVKFKLNYAKTLYTLNITLESAEEK